MSWPVLRCLERGDVRRGKLFKMVRAGIIEVTALYVNPTDLLDRDTFTHSTRYAVDLTPA